MDVEKITAQIKTLRELADLMEELVGTHNLFTIWGKAYSLHDLNFFHDVETTMNTSVGPLAGKFAEFQQYHKHRFDKQRNVIFQGGIADVTVDYGDGRGKAMQLKSTYSDTCATINGLIGDAVNQLTGERGETPRATDRLIVDVVIRSPANPWPFSHKTTYGNKTQTEYETAAKERIKTAIETYNAGATGISPAQVASLTNDQHFNLAYGAPPGAVAPGLGSTQVRSYATSPLTGAQVNNAAHRSITVKVRYDFPYSLKLLGPPVDGQTHIRKAVFEVVRRGASIIVYNPKVTLC